MKQNLNPVVVAVVIVCVVGLAALAFFKLGGGPSAVDTPRPKGPPVAPPGSAGQKSLPPPPFAH